MVSRSLPFFFFYPSTSCTHSHYILLRLSAPTALPSLKPELPLHLASLLTSLFSSSSLPPSLLSQLAVIPSAKAWTLYLDILILSSAGGNLIDLSILAARSALANVRLPQTRSIGFDDDEDGSDARIDGTGTGMTQDEGFSGLVKGGKAGKKAVDFELIDGGEQGVRLHGREDLPIAITFDLVSTEYVCSMFCRSTLTSLTAHFTDQSTTTSRLDRSRILCFTIFPHHLDHPFDWNHLRSHTVGRRRARVSTDNATRERGNKIRHGTSQGYELETKRCLILHRVAIILQHSVVSSE